MTKKYRPAQLYGKFYWRMNRDQQKEAWIDVVSDGLGIHDSAARYLIDNIRSLPFGEDQLREASNLLARVSEGYYDRGPRGKRPILVSLSNVAKLCGAATRGEESKWHHHSPSYSLTLLNLGLSSSNPDAWINRVEFSDSDISGGIYIPKWIDDDVAAALGILYADGYISYSRDTPQLRLGGGRKDVAVYKHDVPKILERAFNFFQVVPEEIDVEHNGERYKTPRIVVASKAIATYLSNWIGFPKSDKERAAFRFPDMLEQYGSSVARTFLKYYVSYKANFSKRYGNTKHGGVRFTEPSKKFLEDLANKLEDTGIKPVTSIQPKSNSFILNISDVPTHQMLEAGLFSANPRLSREIEGAHYPIRVLQPG